MAASFCAARFTAAQIVLRGPHQFFKVPIRQRFNAPGAVHFKNAICLS